VIFQSRDLYHMSTGVPLEEFGVTIPAPSPDTPLSNVILIDSQSAWLSWQ
jgi:hypothetical protein